MDPSIEAKNMEARFWRGTRKGTEDECWEFHSNKTERGYGRVRGPYSQGRKWIRAHRFSYLLHKGSIPCGLIVRHSCDNRLCVNPAHLLLGTFADNTQDSISRNRAIRGSATHNAKLTEADIPEIRKLVRQGQSMASVARKYVVGTMTITNIIQGRSWKHVPDIHDFVDVLT